MKIAAVGDIAPRRAETASIFAEVAEHLRSADVTFGQMECPISDRGSPAPHARLAMRTAPDVAQVLCDVGFDVVSVAGNHVLDFGAEALADTLTHLGAAGIAHCGAGANLAAARVPAVIEVSGKRVVVLAYSSILPEGYAASNSRPGCAPMRAHTHYEQIERDQPGTPPRIITFPDANDLAALVADVAAARAHADVVLVSLHWGIHFVRATIADYQRTVAYAAIDAGADAILGHHPHLLKGIEFFRGKPIFYSLGNFAIEQPAAFDETIHAHESFAYLQGLSSGWQPQAQYQTPPETRHTVIACLDISEHGIVVKLHPCRIDDESVPRLLSPDQAEFAELLRYLKEITAEVGLATDYAIDAEGLISVIDTA